MIDLLDADLLRSFVAVAETGSFTRASERLHRTQSAVSMQIRKLEEQVGHPLFKRTSRTVGLTDKGELLLRQARQILRLHRETLSMLTDPDVSGTVRIGIPDDFAHQLLPPVLSRFSRTHPFVEVEVVCDCSFDLIEMVSEGDVDLALVTSKVKGLEATEVYREPGVWVTSSHHNVHMRDPLPLALFKQGDMLRDGAMKGLRQLGREFRLSYSSSSVAGLQAAVLGGLAVAAVSSSSLLPGMRVLTEDDGVPALPDTIIWEVQAPENADPLVDRLRAQIVEELKIKQRSLSDPVQGDFYAR